MKTSTVIWIVVGLVALWVIDGLLKNSTVKTASTASTGGVNLGSIVNAASGLLSNGLTGTSGTENDEGTEEFGDSGDGSDDEDSGDD